MAVADLPKAREISALRVKAMDLTVAVAVGHIDFTVRRYRNLRRVIEGSTPTRRVAFAKRRKLHAVTREAEDLVERDARPGW